MIYNYDQELIDELQRQIEPENAKTIQPEYAPYVHDWAQHIGLVMGNGLVFDDQGAPYVPITPQDARQPGALVPLELASNMDESEVRDKLENAVMSGQLMFNQLYGFDLRADNWENIDDDTLEFVETAAEQYDQDNLYLYNSTGYSRLDEDRMVLAAMQKQDSQEFVSALIEQDGGPKLSRDGYLEYSSYGISLLDESLLLAPDDAGVDPIEVDNKVLEKYDLRPENYGNILSEMNTSENYVRALAMNEGYYLDPFWDGNTDSGNLVSDELMETAWNTADNQQLVGKIMEQNVIYGGSLHENNSDIEDTKFLGYEALGLTQPISPEDVPDGFHGYAIIGNDNSDAYHWRSLVPLVEGGDLARGYQTDGVVLVPDSQIEQAKGINFDDPAGIRVWSAEATGFKAQLTRQGELDPYTGRSDRNRKQSERDLER